MLYIHDVVIQIIIPGNLQSNTFYKLGVLLALSVAQGGMGFRSLFKGVFDYLCGKEPRSITLDVNVIPDFPARKALEEVIDCRLVTHFAVGRLLSEYQCASSIANVF